MRVRVLGSAAGGGVPQWNCGCEYCAAARCEPALARTGCSVAVSADGSAWTVVNAAAELPRQLSCFRPLRPPNGTRGTPFAQVVLTDAKLDHTLGLLALRQAAALTVGDAERAVAAGAGRHCPAAGRVPAGGVAGDHRRSRLSATTAANLRESRPFTTIRCMAAWLGRLIRGLSSLTKGAIPVVSSNGGTIGIGILWILSRGTPRKLTAYDLNPSRQLSSGALCQITVGAAPGQPLGPPATVVNGRVYAACDNQFVVYGLHRTDIALTGAAGWNTIPVAFSNGDGNWTVTNQNAGPFGTWAAAAGAKVIAGDFNGNGRTDIALTGVPGLNTLPVAFSNGDGTWTVTNQSAGTRTVTNQYVGPFGTWAAAPGAAAYAL